MYKRSWRSAFCQNTCLTSNNCLNEASIVQKVYFYFRPRLDDDISSEINIIYLMHNNANKNSYMEEISRKIHEEKHMS